MSNNAHPALRVKRSTVCQGARNVPERGPEPIHLFAETFRWQRSLEALDAEGLPVSEFPQSPARMAPATARFYEAATNGRLTHADDARLNRHISACHLKDDARGSRVVKESRRSTRRIDLAVAAVMAFDRAAHLTPEEDYDVLQSIY